MRRRSQSFVWAFAFELCRVSGASAEFAIEISEASPATIEAPMRIGAPSLVTEIRVRNTAGRSGTAQVYRASPTLVRQSDGLAVQALWKQLDPSADTKTIASGSELVLQLSADLVEPGTYETWIDTTPAEGDAVRGAEAAARAVCASAAAALRKAADEALSAQGQPEWARTRARAALEGLGQISDLGERVSAIADAWTTFGAVGKGTASLERRRGLEALNGPGGVPNSVSVTPSLDVPADLWLLLGLGEGLETLSRARAVNEWTTHGLILVGIGCAGVALIASNDNWGFLGRRHHFVPRRSWLARRHWRGGGCDQAARRVRF